MTSKAAIAADCPLGLDFISGLAMPPVAFVELAADLGCSSVSLGVNPITANPHDYAPWSLVEDAALLRAVKAAMAANGVTMSAGEGCFIMPGLHVAAHARALDVFADLGARLVSVVILDPEGDRWPDEAAALVEMAKVRGMGSAVEFIPTTPVGDVPAALAAVARIGDGLQIVIDMMHLYRSGGIAADIAALDPAVIAQVQICDVPMRNPSMEYGHEAGHERLVPGTGELPLREALRAVPAGVPLSLEVPMLSRAMTGEGPKERLAEAVAATRRLFATLDA